MSLFVSYNLERIICYFRLYNCMLRISTGKIGKIIANKFGPHLFERYSCSEPILRDPLRIPCWKKGGLLHAIFQHQADWCGFCRSTSAGYSECWFPKHNTDLNLTAVPFETYRKVSNIRRTKCQNLNDSRLVLQLPVPNPLKPSIKSIIQM